MIGAAQRNTGLVGGREDSHIGQMNALTDIIPK